MLTILFSLFWGLNSFLCHAADESIAIEKMSFDRHTDNAESRPGPCVIVVFGATGDLTARKLLPAIYNLAHERNLSENTVVIGVARSENTSEIFRQKMSHAIDQFSRTKSIDHIFWDHFKNKIFYHPSDCEKDHCYEKLQKLLSEIDKDFGTQGNRIYYLATPPSYFPVIIEKLHTHGLIYDIRTIHDKWSKVVIEKPFGYDLDSAIQLQEQLSKCLDESQIYRMDHYLGKEGVQNLLSFRFENALFASLWNNEHIDNVQITLGEDIGIGSRANFWEQTGSLRDVFQNHLMQLLAIIAMEPPLELKADTIHGEKIKVLNAIRPFKLSKIDQNMIRGQYGPGVIQGMNVSGYREEKGVAESSSVESFIAARIFIDNPRWTGVPFYIRGGKRLAKQTTEIAITFKKNPLSIDQDPNVLFIRIQPNPGIFLKTMSKVPGFDKGILPVIFGYKPEAIFGKSSPEAYEKLIWDCMRGDDNLFVDAEEQLAAWRLLTPVLEYWKANASKDFPNYDAGTWGPSAADQMLIEDSRRWQLLDN